METKFGAESTLVRRGFVLLNGEVQILGLEISDFLNGSEIALQKAIFGIAFGQAQFEWAFSSSLRMLDRLGERVLWIMMNAHADYRYV